MRCITNFLTFLMIKVVYVKCNDVLGCGGFIKSHVPIDFSKIEVELFTKQGILKDKTSCAPNNGYYFIPLYDKGDYIIQLQPPPGWSFTPTKVSLVVDGSTDLCAQGNDINFIFKGFGITGSIENFNKQGPRPKGIKVVLKFDGDNDVRITETGSDGSFFFTPVYPGKYIVEVSHAKWKLLKSRVSVQVAEGNTELPSGSLIIAGYDVNGFVRSEGQPVSDVNVVLFQHELNKGPIYFDGCLKTPLPNIKYPGRQLCHVFSTKTGSYTFPTVSSGKYVVVPYYQGQNIHFHPNWIEFDVVRDSVLFEQPFEVVGFSISGRVLNAKGGKPLPGAVVLLNGEQIAITKADGSYVLEKIKTGLYRLNVLADSLQFEESAMQISPNILILPDLYPSKYQVCGTVLSSKQQTVIVNRLGTSNNFLTTSETPNGLFCHFLSCGKYQVRVSISDIEINQGIQFFPLSHTFEVISAPISGIIFSQLKATVTGKVKCIKNVDCSMLRVVLRPIVNEAPAETKDIIVGIIDKNVFTFKDVRPGEYEIFLTPNKFCWKNDKHIILVSSTHEEVPTFEQSGYSVVFVSSHSVKISYTNPGEKLKKQIEIKSGRTSYCIEMSGHYNFTLDSCHTYENNKISFDTGSNMNEIYLTAQKHATTIGIEAKENFGNLFVTVNMGGVKRQEGPLLYKDRKYILMLFLDPTDEAILVPESDVLYFNPPILSISGQDDCADLGIQFLAVKGKVFEGKIIPPLSGVLITIETENSEALMAETDSNGRYKFPPQDDAKEYKIFAKKDTYVLVGPNESGSFLARKLAEVIVQVVDRANGSPLQGALLSLSGGESYRSNLQTNEAGKITFHSLSPGEYFLRPMMKEYSFEPSSKIINVVEGATVNVTLQGRRVAYSCFGNVMSLNGEPEERITIIAAGVGNCSHFSEEATSEVTGQFRIRGLQPRCTYTVEVKGTFDDRRPIERAAPSSVDVQVLKDDLRNLKFTIFRALPNTDIMVRVYSANPDIYRNLKVKLVRESSPSNLVHMAKLDSLYKITKDNNAGVLVQIPSVPLDDKIYSIQLESSSSPNVKHKAHTYYFTANASFKYIDLEYFTKAVTAEQNIKQTSLWTLMLIFGSLIAVYNIEQTAQIVKQQIAKLNLGGLSNSFNIFRRKSTPTLFDKNEIDQIVQSINATKRKLKPRKT